MTDKDNNNYIISNSIALELLERFSNDQIDPQDILIICTNIIKFLVAHTISVDQIEDIYDEHFVLIDEFSQLMKEYVDRKEISPMELSLVINGVLKAFIEGAE